MCVIWRKRKNRNRKRRRIDQRMPRWHPRRKSVRAGSQNRASKRTRPRRIFKKKWKRRRSRTRRHRLCHRHRNHEAIEVRKLLAMSQQVCSKRNECNGKRISNYKVKYRMSQSCLKWVGSSKMCSSRWARLRKSYQLVTVIQLVLLIPTPRKFLLGNPGIRKKRRMLRQVWSARPIVSTTCCTWLSN